MKALKIILIVLAVLVAVVTVLGLVAPKKFDFHREVVINAPEETVWKGISTFEEFNKWNPWYKRDPNIQLTMEGTDGTVGAKHSWVSEKREVGTGSMTIAMLEPNKAVEYDLAFGGGMEMKSTGYMTMEKTEGGQKVVWGIRGETPFPFNALSLFMNMDKEVGKDFDEGLAGLKALSESAPKP